MQDLISMRDISKEEILNILEVAGDIKRVIHGPTTDSFSKKYGTEWSKILEGISVATLFLENSTRTNYSFRAAVVKAGGTVDGFPTQDHTSLKKGETWADTASMFAGYGYDALVIRSTEEGLPRWTKEILTQNNQQLSNQHQEFGIPFSYKVPSIINGGDGKNQHPSQCLLDLFTMQEIARSQGKELDGLDLALLNDIKHGRTISSLISVANLFNFRLHFAYPNRFGPTEDVVKELREKGVKVQDYETDFTEALRNSSIAYHSRPQKERVGQGEDFEAIKRIGQINRSIYDSLGKNAPFLMHPLPIDAETFAEISEDMRDHPKNVTKYQSSNGLYVRIALLGICAGRIDSEIKTETASIGTTLEEIALHEHRQKLDNPVSGYIRNSGIVIDHIPPGMGRRLAGVLGLEAQEVRKVISDYLPSSKQGGLKDLVKIHGNYELTSEQHDAIALIAPHATINVIDENVVTRKYQIRLGQNVTGRIVCVNDGCISNVEKEGIQPKHYIEQTGENTKLRCQYCEVPDTVDKAYKQNRFVYIGE
ncbi:MAG: aspartate carbamoyltransferase regulatory subunit [archaeon]|nr:aspartate carbamoyltransferase regulatory subunit [archaeon]